jgi:lipopolysaccharide export LptBFGC system permease protein LptF
VAQAAGASKHRGEIPRAAGRMPELHWIVGYPLSLLAMVFVSLVLYRAFKRRGWL